MKLFTVFDCKATAYTVPFYERTSGLAIRAFTSAANDPEHQFNRYPADYTLFLIGDFDDQTAAITMLDTPVNLGVAVTFVEQLSLPGGLVPMGIVAGGD